MKQRILTNWTFARALFLVVGITVIVQSVLSQPANRIISLVKKDFG
jgi:hypothetical protein